MIAKSFAKYFSYLFVPPSFTLLLFIYTSLKFTCNPVIPILLSVLLTFILPIIIFMLFRKKGKVKDFDASVKEERTGLYIVGIVLCLIGFLVSLFYPFADEFTFLWIVYIVNTSFLILVNKFWKISAHMIGISAPIGAFVLFNPLIAGILLLLAFLLAWARLYLKMHTILQIIIGFLFGFLLTFIQLKIYL